MKEISVDDHPQYVEHQPKDEHKRVVDPLQYLFHQPKSFPVQEYMLTSAEDWTSSTPSFILEVTWPRIALFYHPTSPLCQQMQTIFVELARHIRHSMTGKQGMVEFWAVSCQVHEVACQELGIKSVPYLLGFPQGRIEGIPIPRTRDNQISVDWALQSIDLKLDNVVASDVEGEDGEETDESNKRENRQGGENDKGEMEQDPVEDEGEDSTSDKDEKVALHQLLHPHGDGGAGAITGGGNVDHHRAPLVAASSSTSVDVFHDATCSFLYHLDQIVGRIATTAAEDSKQQRQSLYRQQQLLKEWFDLLHWTLPSRSFAPVHDILNDLRNTQGSSSSSSSSSSLQPQLYIKHILSSHGYYQRPDLYQTWSPSSCGTICGFWDLLHIISIGVVEQHAHVMGDVNRVTVRHAWEVILQVITVFGFVQDKENRNNKNDKIANKRKLSTSHRSSDVQKLMMQSYQECIKTVQCRLEMGVDSRLLSSTPLALLRRALSWFSPSDRALQAIGEQIQNEKELWKLLAIWLWKVHNVYRRDVLGNEEESPKDVDTPWPPQSKCHVCYIVDESQQKEAMTSESSSSSSGMVATTWLDEQEDVLWDLNAVFTALRKTYWPHGILTPRLVVLDRHHQYRQLYIQSFPTGSERIVWFSYIFVISLLVIAAVFCGVVELVRWYFQRHRSKSYYFQHKKDLYDDPFRGDFSMGISNGHDGGFSKRRNRHHNVGAVNDGYQGPRRRGAWESLWR